MLIKQVGLAQHLTFPKLLALQKQDFNKSNNFFIDDSWEIADTKSNVKTDDGYITTWQKRSPTGMGMCRIVFNPMKEAKRADISLNHVTYISDSKNDYSNIRHSIEALGYKPEKPVLEGNSALSAYTDGYIVVLIGLSGKLYVVKVMSYFGYAAQYLGG